ncbi:hypothetical protein N7517_010543 [Penicillium concentricum]|uniref:Uncharacterized protein n=1 Tax=Penicillium concentricum TaxID=293559 RepID=A0A9W9RAZ9_9EURO|nr:uncharacterized protein N7517_010543 [Penicillium concentricum]KAJ5355934.1 hypothetical protein N7517_010543 [Penicillium concentricum]
MAIAFRKLKMPESKLREAPMSKSELSPHVHAHVKLQGRSCAYKKFGLKRVETTPCGTTTSNHKCATLDTRPGRAASPMNHPGVLHWARRVPGENPIWCDWDVLENGAQCLSYVYTGVGKLLDLQPT